MQGQHTMPATGDWYRHIGVYAYRTGFLHKYVTWAPAPLEQLESLEQLRALYNGIGIHVANASEAVPGGVDTQEDLEVVGLDAGGQPRYAFYGRDGADRAVTPDTLPDELDERITGLHVDAKHPELSAAAREHLILAAKAARRAPPAVRPSNALPRWIEKFLMKIRETTPSS